MVACLARFGHCEKDRGKQVMNENTDISRQALLAGLTISTWSARKYDRKVTDDVHQLKHTANDAGRYNKCLLPGDAASFKALGKIAGEARVKHYTRTLPWTDGSYRLLPVTSYMDYCSDMRSLGTAFEQARDAFIADYPTLVQTAMSHLGIMFNAEDYPDVSRLPRMFAFNVSFVPLPARGDFRLDTLSDDRVADLEAALMLQQSAQLETAMSDAWRRLYDVVVALRNKLADSDSIFRNSLVENIAECCQTLGTLNITHDPNLDQMRQSVLDSLTVHDPDTLRENKIVRSDVAQTADDILKQMSAFYSPKA